MGGHTHCEMRYKTLLGKEVKQLRFDHAVEIRELTKQHDVTLRHLTSQIRELQTILAENNNNNNKIKTTTINKSSPQVNYLKQQIKQMKKEVHVSTQSRI